MTGHRQKVRAQASVEGARICNISNKSLTMEQVFSFHFICLQMCRNREVHRGGDKQGARCTADEVRCRARSNVAA